MKLQGIRVIELTRFLPGPYVTRMLVDHGAEVIKVESHAGEPTRTLGTQIDGQAAYFRNTHRGKKSIVIDLKSPDGKAVFLKLADKADVVVESFRPGVVTRLGIDYATVAARNPGVVYCSISAFGQTGPLYGRVSHDLGVQAQAGALSLGRNPEQVPPIPGVPAADTAVALTALAGILMALVRRRDTGLGDYIDAAMFDSTLSWTPQVSEAPLALGAAPQNDRERIYGGAAFYRVYETRDGKYIALSGSEASFAKALLTALGRVDLIPLCEQPAGDIQLPVRKFLAVAFLERTRDEWTQFLSTIDVCFAPVQDLKEAYDDPQTAAREMIVSDCQGHRYLGTPLKFMREPAVLTSGSPSLGEHTAGILADLGLSPDAIESLRRSRACG